MKNKEVILINIFENEEIVYSNYEGLEYIQFKKLLEFGIKHAYTLKSKDINFSEHSKERDFSFKILSKALDIKYENFVRPIQTHSDKVKCIDKVESIEELKNTDGLITNKKNIALISRNADCILMLFYDPVKKVIANVHSGWRGTFKKIGEKTINKMINYYGCNPKDIYCFICPCIRKCHFEVDDDVKILCENIFSFLDTKEFIVKGDIVEEKQKYFIDTVLINKILLKEIGLQEKNIIDSNICSVCNKDKVHSYRVEKENKKIATSIIVL